MKDAERQTRSHLMELFEQHGFHPRTALGQNFLIDLNIVDYIVRHAKLDEHDVVLEIGAGTGGMTTFMAQEAGSVVSVELDHNMFALASAVVEDYDHVRLLNIDALRNKNNFSDEVLQAVEEELAIDEKRKLKLIANLPYSIATPVVSNLVATELPWSRIVVTIQWELGLRMCAKPSTSQYGALSVWLQAQCEVKILKKLGPTVFWPRPKVESAIVRLIPNPKKRKRIVDREFFHDFIRRLFRHRRKLMRSVLVGMYRKQLSKPEIDSMLERHDVPLTVRAEELSVEKLVEISNVVCCLIQDGQQQQPPEKQNAPLET